MENKTVNLDYDEYHALLNENKRLKDNVKTLSERKGWVVNIIDATVSIYEGNTGGIPCFYTRGGGSVVCKNEDLPDFISSITNRNISSAKEVHKKIKQFRVSTGEAEILRLPSFRDSTVSLGKETLDSVKKKGLFGVIKWWYQND